MATGAKSESAAVGPGVGQRRGGGGERRKRSGTDIYIKQV